MPDDYYSSSLKVPCLFGLAMARSSLGLHLPLVTTLPLQLINKFLFTSGYSDSFLGCAAVEERSEDVEGAITVPWLAL